jgi:hypothetical protein
VISFDYELFVGAVFTAIGGIGVAAAFRDLARAADSEDWPQVDAEIIETGVITDFGARTRLFAPLVRYRYHAGDQQLVGDCIAFGGPIETSFRWPAEHIVEHYQQGRTVRVRVCPTNPSMSVLEPGTHWYNYLMALITALFAAIGIRILLTHFDWLGPLPDWFHIR